MRALSLPFRVAYWGSTAADAVAVDGGDRRVTYGALSTRMGQYAAALRAAGVRRGDRVVLGVPKSAEAVAALLGILAAGGAYVPVDPRAPAARRQLVVEESAPRAIVGLLAGDPAPSGAALVAPEAVGPDAPVAPPEVVEADDDAYVLYTSGSTGRPNGVRISHRALHHFLLVANSVMDVERDSVCVNTSALFFDASVVDLLLPLYHGATVLLGGDIVFPEAILDLIEGARATHIASVGTTMNLLADSRSFASRDLGSLRRYMAGAESLSHMHVTRWLEKCPDLTVVNGYGPTESTCVCVVFRMDRSWVARHRECPIGHALPGSTLHVEQGADDGDGATGELWVAGPQLMSGYLDRPALNAEKFIERDGVRYYKTGDVVRWDMHGRLHFVGRVDDQIKVRGYRVDLGDVAAPYLKNTDVVAAIAVPAVHPRLGECLAVAVKLRTEGLDLGELNRAACKELPEYMRPKYVLRVDELPVNSSGKVDTKAVRELVRRELGGETAGRSSPDPAR